MGAVGEEQWVSREAWRKNSEGVARAAKGAESTEEECLSDGGQTLSARRPGWALEERKALAPSMPASAGLGRIRNSLGRVKAGRWEALVKRCVGLMRYE